MKRPIVIFHKDCADGFGACWSFWRHFGDNAMYYAGSYNAPVPDVVDRDVYLVDFSYKHDQVETMLKFAKSVTLIDHHKSALEDLWPLQAKGLDMKFCSNEKSGAMLAWEFMQTIRQKKETTPRMIAYIQDRDLWRFELPGSKEVSMFLFSHEYDMKVWDKFMKATKREIDGYIKLGAILEKKHIKDVNEMIRVAKRYVDLGEYKYVPLLNVPYLMASDAGTIMSMDAPFSATYYDNRDNRIFSLRSNKDNPSAADVSAIAFAYGGGGHFHAAGFKVPREHELAKV
jgi:oligoribonuclease NrnB/cAMP/cGMP phosphodiesterase (DHH superfamily)